MDTKSNNTTVAGSDFLHRIICGDCVKILRELPDKCIDLVVTDPPYDISVIGGGEC